MQRNSKGDFNNSKDKRKRELNSFYFPFIYSTDRFVPRYDKAPLRKGARSIRHEKK